MHNYRTMTQFTLTELEERRKEKFYEKCKKKLKGGNVNLYYKFFPTGIGTVVIIGCEKLKLEKDITDLNNW